MEFLHSFDFSCPKAASVIKDGHGISSFIQFFLPEGPFCNPGRAWNFFIHSIFPARRRLLQPGMGMEFLHSFNFSCPKAASVIKDGHGISSFIQFFLPEGPFCNPGRAWNFFIHSIFPARKHDQRAIPKPEACMKKLSQNRPHLLCQNQLRTVIISLIYPSFGVSICGT